MYITGINLFVKIIKQIEGILLAGAFSQNIPESIKK